MQHVILCWTQHIVSILGMKNFAYEYFCPCLFRLFFLFLLGYYFSFTSAHVFEGVAP